MRKMRMVHVVDKIRFRNSIFLLVRNAFSSCQHFENVHLNVRILFDCYELNEVFVNTVSKRK